jgi:hypothetical protein
VSTLDSSLLLRMSVSSSSGEPDLEVEAVSPQKVPYEANERTIVAAQVSDHLVQVTPHGVFVVDPRQSAVAATWTDLEPAQSILVAACMGNDVLVGMADGVLLALKVDFCGTSAVIHMVK